MCTFFPIDVHNPLASYTTFPHYHGVLTELPASSSSALSAWSLWSAPVAWRIWSKCLSWFSKMTTCHSESLALSGNKPFRAKLWHQLCITFLNLGDIRFFIQPNLWSPRCCAGCWGNRLDNEGCAFQIPSTGSILGCWFSSQCCLCSSCRLLWASSTSACSTDWEVWTEAGPIRILPWALELSHLTFIF
jgi:hypothetical protein